MSEFTTRLTITQLSGTLWEADKQFSFYRGPKNQNEFILIKKGYVSDGASIPRFAWPLVGHPMGAYAQAAFIHDKLYGTLGLNGRYSRRECDKIFVEAMKVLGIPAWKRAVMYRALRIGGWKGWNKRKRQLKIVST